jgi:hypothetical protein
MTSFPDRPAPRRGRDRRHLFPGRTHRLFPRFTSEENADIRAAAQRVGLTPTGFCAHAALNAARGHQTYPAVEQAHLQELVNLQIELATTRVAINQIRAALDQAGTARTDQGCHNELAQTIVHAASTLVSVDEVTARIGRRLVRRRGGCR